MTTTQIVFAVAALPAIYALHRFCLHLEDRGYLYYLHKKPKPGGGSPFLQYQEFYQPQIRNVIEAENLAAHSAEADRHVPDPLNPVRSGAAQASPDRDEAPPS